MSDENGSVDYAGMYAGEYPNSEPVVDPAVEQAEAAAEATIETIEDLIDPEVEEQIEEIIENAAEEVVAVVEEAAEPPAPIFFKPAIDDGAKLNIRATPNGDILTKVTNAELLHVLEDGPEWAKVQFDEAGSTVVGYAKKQFLVEA